MGPTASGKTALAIELAKRFPLEIISVDSALVYRGMDIGTAKPDADLLRLSPHRLIDIRDHHVPCPDMLGNSCRHDPDWSCACDQHILANQIERQSCVDSVSKRVQNCTNVVANIIWQRDDVEGGQA